MGRNTTHGRRRGILIASIVGAIALGILAVILVNVAADERITRYQVDAAVQPDGSTLVREIIDYDFGSESRHGIFRFFPGYSVAPTDPAGPNVITDVEVRSASAPDDLNLDDAVHGELKIGSPEVEISGRHQYLIAYRLPPTPGLPPGQIGLDVVGTDWQVPIDEVVVRIELPTDATNVRCVSGDAGSDEACSGLGRDGRMVTVEQKDLGDHQGITVFADLSGTGSATALPSEPTLAQGDPDWVLRAGAPFVGLALLGYIAGLIPVAAYARRLGRDWAWGDTAVDAVFGGPGIETRRIDDVTAEEQVTIQFVPPKDLTPAQGGLVLKESITDSHRIAWLMDYSMSGWIAIENEGKRLRWTASDDKWAQAPAPLHTMFAGRHVIDLSSYDKEFAEGWGQIAGELDSFKKTSGLWDADATAHARRRSTLIFLVAIPVIILCSVAAINLLRTAPLVTAGIGALLGLAFGAGFSALANRGELQVRTAQGFSQRQLTEGFRRFFQVSETRHVVEAAQRDQLRLYSAWAIALDQVENWNRMIKAAQIPANSAGLADVAYMSAFASSVHTASTAPSSSSSGGGGGSVGGGGGGGGGGSW